MSMNLQHLEQKNVIQTLQDVNMQQAASPDVLANGSTPL